MLYQKILEKEGITLDDFNCSSMPELASEGSERIAMITPGNLRIQKEKTTVKLSFDLPKGCYATTFLSSLFLKNIK